MVKRHVQIESTTPFLSFPSVSPKKIEILQEFLLQLLPPHTKNKIMSTVTKVFARQVSHHDPLLNSKLPFHVSQWSSLPQIRLYVGSSDPHPQWWLLEEGTTSTGHVPLSLIHQITHLPTTILTVPILTPPLLLS